MSAFFIENVFIILSLYNTKALNYNRRRGDFNEKNSDDIFNDFNGC